MLSSEPSVPSPAHNTSVDDVVNSTNVKGEVIKGDFISSGGSSSSSRVFIGNLPEGATARSIIDTLTELNEENRYVKVSLKLHHLNHTISATVEFNSYDNALEAIERFNNTNFVGSSKAKFEWALSFAELASNVESNLFIKGVPLSLTEEQLLDMITSNNVSEPSNLKLSKDIEVNKYNTLNLDNNNNENELSNQHHRGYGYLSFNSATEAERCMELFNNKLSGTGIICSFFTPKWKRSKNFTNIIVKNLPPNTAKEMITDHLFRGLNILSILIKSTKNNTQTYAFVNFSNHDDATTAVQMSNSKVDSQLCPYNEEEHNTSNPDNDLDQKSDYYILDIQRYKDKIERQLKSQDDRPNSPTTKANSSLYISGLSLNTVRGKLSDLLSTMGAVKDVYIRDNSTMKNHNGTYKPNQALTKSAIAVFASPAEACKVMKKTGGCLLFDGQAIKLNHYSKKSIFVKHQVPSSSNTARVTARDWQNIGDHLYRAVLQLYQNSPHLAAKITGMVMELEYNDLVLILGNADLFKLKVREAVEVLKEVGLYEDLTKDNTNQSASQ